MPPNDTPIHYSCLSFNQDFSCLCAGSDTALRIYNVDPFGECFELGEGASVASMLFSTSLVTVVGAGTGGPSQSTRRLRILNTKKKATICELTFPTAVLAVRLNRKRLVVVLLDQIYVYDISCMKLLHTIETSPNEAALCDLSASDDSILLYPAPGASVASPFNGDTRDKKAAKGSEVGTVVLFDALNIAPLNIIKAHKTDLAALALNTNGTLFATASNKGTIVRVFNTFSGVKVGEFRRGSYTAQIHSLIFDTSSTLLAAGSDTETIHIFKLDGDSGQREAEAHLDENDNDVDVEDEDDDDEFQERILPRQSSVASLNEPQPRKRHTSITDKLFSNLPKNISSILEPQRDYASLKISNPLKNKHSIGFNGKDVLVASSDGVVYVYQLPSKGGECVLMKQYALE